MKMVNGITKVQLDVAIMDMFKLDIDDYASLWLEKDYGSIISSMKIAEKEVLPNGGLKLRINYPQEFLDTTYEVIENRSYISSVTSKVDGESTKIY